MRVKSETETSTTGDESGYTPRANSDDEEDDESLSAVTVCESGSQIIRANIAVNRPKIDVEQEKNMVGVSSGIVRRSQIIITNSNRYRWNTVSSSHTEEEGTKDQNSFSKN